MTDHAIILSMIERVDPSDSVALDEIDARVHVYKSGNRITDIGYDFSGRLYVTFTNDPPFTIDRPPLPDITLKTNRIPQYTRSRDALKAIRPERWYFDIEAMGSDKDWWLCTANKSSRSDKFMGCAQVTSGHHFTTEELAELHAIIQAIAYERAQA
jgi:hypothetical protein